MVRPGRLSKPVAIVYGFGLSARDAAPRTMLDDARTLENDARLEADLCIVGGGIAGLTIARALSGERLSVVVLESGGRSDAGKAESLLEGNARGQLLSRANRYLSNSRTRRLGGQSTRWHRECRGLDPLDLSGRPWAAMDGWPLERAQLESYYAKARALVELGAPGASTPGELAGEDSRFAATWLDYCPTTALDETWRSEAVSAPGVRVLTHATATELALEDAGHRVAEAIVRCLEGPSFRVRARHFVLAAGALENARLLLASNSTRSAGLGNGRDLVGRYFMDQPLMRAGFVFLAGAGRGLARFDEPTTAPGRRVALVPEARTQVRHEVLNSLAWIEPVDAEEAGSLASAIEGSVTALGRRAGDGADPGLFGELLIRGEQLPRRGSRVALDTERDPLGMPRIDLTWTLAYYDGWSLRTTARLLGEALGRRRLGRLQLRAGNRPRRRFYGWSGHQSGTTRMSREESAGVVDTDCRLHEVPNVHVAGSSVFPSSGSAGPVLTILALALRLADRLRRELDP